MRHVFLKFIKKRLETRSNVYTYSEIYATNAYVEILGVTKIEEKDRPFVFSFFFFFFESALEIPSFRATSTQEL